MGRLFGHKEHLVRVAALFAAGILVFLALQALLVPKGFAHGYLTLSPQAAVLYHVSTPYTPAAENGIRWNDPYFRVDWPVREPLLSGKDAGWPDFTGTP